MNAADFTNRIVTQLRILDPAASAEVGTPERKIIEAAAEVMASATVDFSMINQQHDVDSMVGARLEAYLGNFGFARQTGTNASGFVTFTRNTASQDTVVIPAGTLLKASLSGAEDGYLSEVRFATLLTVVMMAGTNTTSAQIQATVPGEIGNVEAGAITQFAGLNTPLNLSGVSNQTPTTGGTNPEDDIAFKLRFKNTLFRNIAGTYDQFLAMAVQAATVTKANVVGPVSRFREYVQIPDANDDAQITQVPNAITQTYASGGYDDDGTRWVNKRSTEPSVIPYSKYTYTDQQYLTNGDFDPATATFFRPYVDYVFNPTPVIHEFDDWTAGTAYPLGAVVQDPGGTKVMQATVAGTSHAITEPTWPTTLNGTVTDGTVAWKYVSVITKQTLDYSMANRPNITVLGGTEWPAGMEPGDLLLLEHAYMSSASRNDFGLGIMNCVDIYINGERSREASSTHVVPTSSNNIQSTDPGAWTYNLYGQTPATSNVVNWKRRIDGRASRSGNRLMPLYWQPATDAPATIVIEGNTFYRANYYYSSSMTSVVSGSPVSGTYYAVRTGAGTDESPYVFSVPAHYVFVEEVNGLYGTVRGRGGIEWFLSGNPLNYLKGREASDSDTAYTGSYIDSTTVVGGKSPLAGKEFTARGYSYDQNVIDLQVAVDRAKQVTTDVLVHRAKPRYLKLYINVMYELGSNHNVTDAAIREAIAAYYERQYYGAAMQLSDMLQAIHNVPGVDNVRWTSQDHFDNVQTYTVKTYKLGETVKPTVANGYYYRCITNTSTTTSIPTTWPTTSNLTNGGTVFEPVFAMKVEEVNEDGESLDSAITGKKFYTDDFYMRDNELPAAPNESRVVIERRAANTWTEI